MGIKVLNKMKLFEDKYLFELENGLAVVTTDSDGDIVQVALFGEDLGYNKSISDKRNADIKIKNKEKKI